MRHPNQTKARVALAGFSLALSLCVVAPSPGLAQSDSATKRAIALRDTILFPRPARPEKVRAERREHILAATGVATLAVLTFLLFNLRTR